MFIRKTVRTRNALHQVESERRREVRTFRSLDAVHATYCGNGMGARDKRSGAQNGFDVEARRIFKTVAEKNQGSSVQLGFDNLFHVPAARHFLASLRQQNLSESFSAVGILVAEPFSVLFAHCQIRPLPKSPVQR